MMTHKIFRHGKSQLPVPFHHVPSWGLLLPAPPGWWGPCLDAVASGNPGGKPTALLSFSELMLLFLTAWACLASAQLQPQLRTHHQILQGGSFPMIPDP